MVQKDTLWGWLLQGFKYELDTQVAPRTVKYYYDRVCYFSRWALGQGLDNPQSSTKRDVQAYFHYLAHTRDTIEGGNGSRRTVQRGRYPHWHHYRCLKRFFTWALSERHIDRNPLDGIKVRHPRGPSIEPWQPEHIERFFAVLARDWQVARTTRHNMLAARDETVLSLFLESGLRLAELSSLRSGDVDLDRQRVVVRKGKTGEGRLVGFGPRIKKAFWRYLSLRSCRSKILVLVTRK